MKKTYYGAMIDPDIAIKVLKQLGARMTAQRFTVLDILHNNYSHPSAEEIIDKVRERLGHVSTATIYNTLDTLEKHGFIMKLDGLETKSHYDPNTKEHSHCICTKCKSIFDVAYDIKDSNCDLPNNFVVSNVIFHGTCDNCRPN